MTFKRYKHLNVPDSWERYFTKYPQGMSILESLFEWVSQVDSMVDNQNKLSANVEQFRIEIDEFVGRFDERLQTEVSNTLTDWQTSGFLDVVISSALQWQLDDYISTNEQDKLSLTAQLQQTRKWVNVKNFGARGDGVSFDSEAINEAILYASENQMNVYIPEGTYILDKSIELKPKVSIYGSNVFKTVLRKTVSSINTQGFDCVMHGRNCDNFELSGFTLRGNRKSYAEGNAVTSDGLHLQGCSYFSVKAVRADNCKIGFISRTNWCCVYERTVALMCQSYAYRLDGSSTSHLVLQPTSWGCGGGFYITSCIYTTIVNPANDHSDAGGRTDDPFLPQGSGGNHLDPKYIFEISGSSVTIISSGTEDSSSQYLYNEGSTVDLINPYIFGTNLNKLGAKFIESRGGSRSITNITNPDFRFIKKMNETLSPITNYFFIDNPTTQKIKINTPLIPDKSFQENAVARIDGVLFTDTEKIINITEHTVYEYMKPPFEYDSSVFQVKPIGKKIAIRKIATGSTTSELLIPIKKGSYYVKQKNVSSSQYSPVKLDLIRKNINGVEVHHTFLMNNEINTGGIFEITEDDYKIRIRLTHSTDVLDFETFIVERIL